MANLPQYKKIRDSLAERIFSGQYKPGSRIPPEEDLAKEFGVSRMTANKAILGLVREGYLVRRRRAGTFVTDLKAESTLIEVRNIAEEIRERNHEYSNQVLLRETVVCNDHIAALMGLEAGSEVFHTVLVHYENETAIQFEDRYVNRERVPTYLQTDFALFTPNDVLVASAPLSDYEYTVEAVLPSEEIAKELGIKADTPCLQMMRRTWSGEDLISYVELTLPGNRYKLRGQR